MAKLAFTVISSIPLLTSHSQIFGYAEIWVAALFIASAGFFIFATDLQSLKYCVMFFLTSLLIVFLKNTGIIYAASLWLASLLYFFRQSRRMLLLIFFTAAAAMLLVAWLGVSLNFFGVEIKYSPDAQRLFVGGHSMVVKLYELTEVLKGQYVALLANQSFSILFFVQLILTFGLCARIFSNRKSCAEGYLIGLSWIFLITLFLGQLTLHYVNRVSGAGSDIGLSRTLLPIVCVTVPCWFSVLGLALVRRKDPSASLLQV
jgi:hypothetical protein